MDIHNYVVVIGGIIAIISAIYKLVIEPSIDAKIASLETKGFILIDNFKGNINDKLTTLDRKVDIHMQDYSNYKEANLLQANGLNERINHSWNKTKELFNDEKIERKEIQVFLKNQRDYKNRE
ncbi:hypothetical protein [Nostoc sp.]|uniref:hypothetical protein n=1 Tax=Nostoc sp. TaxID=1180 RepID=UPI002FFD4AE3